MRPADTDGQVGSDAASLAEALQSRLAPVQHDVVMIVAAAKEAVSGSILAVRLKGRPDLRCWLIVWEQDFYPFEAGVRGCCETIWERSFLKEPRKVGIESRHWKF